MQFRNIFIASERHLVIKNNQLVIDEAEEISFPVEDINSIIIENGYTSLSASAIRILADNEVVVYICDEKHIPSAVLLPMVKHSRHFKMLKAQFETTKPLYKQLWQSIVIKKVQNQARCLEILNIEGDKELYAMSKEVKSGDTTHVEAKAAAFYFRRLFGADFARADKNIINSMLNYGYAIIRGMIARTIVAYGFEPSVGIWHKSELNSYNLADDLIEPYRPFVDLYVASFMDTNKEELVSGDKKMIAKIMNYEMLLNGEHRIVKNCIDMMVSSFSSSIKEGENKIILPDLGILREHRYE